MIDSFMAFLAQDFYLVVLGIAAVFLFVRYRARWRELAAAALVIGVVAFALAKLGAHFIDDPRPFLVAHTAPLIPSATDNGFPSDHTLLLGTVAAVVTVAAPLPGLIFWALAGVVGLARVYAGVHHVLDIAGSLVMVAAALAVYAGVRRLWTARRTPVP